MDELTGIRGQMSLGYTGPANFWLSKATHARERTPENQRLKQNRDSEKSMPEMTHSGEDHRKASLVGSLNHFIIAD